MRVTDKMGFNQVTSNLQKNRSEMSDLQNQAATQKRINKPSDDPVAAARVLGARSDEKMNKQFLKNIDVARSFLETADVSLNELTENLVRAKELTLQAANDPGGGEETRRITALEIAQIYNQAIQVANRKLGERYVFGGFKTNHQPFDNSGNYHGDDGDIKIQINKDTYVAMNVSGDKIFQGQGLGGDGIARQKSDTPKSTDELQEYKQQEFERNQKKIERESQPNNVELRGPASVSDTRRKATRVGPPGEDYDTVGINILQTLKDLEIGLKVNDKEVIQESIDNLDQAISQVVNTRAQVGSRIMALTNTGETLQKQIIENKGTASSLEDADLFQVVSDIQKGESTLKATLETSGKVIQPSLMDFIK